MDPWDLHQKDEPMEHLAWITNGTDVRKSQDAIGNWNSPHREASCIILLSPWSSGKKKKLAVWKVLGLEGDSPAALVVLARGAGKS